MSNPAPAAAPRIAVFRINVYEWVAASSLEEAARHLQQEYGLDDVEVLDDCAGEVGDADMDRLVFADLEERDAKGKPVRRTFRAELDRRIARGETFPQLFASTEI